MKQNNLKSIAGCLMATLASTLLFSCSTVLKTFPAQQKLTTGKIIINKNVDLQGKTLSLPKGCALVFKRGGLISNGVIEGAETRIKYSGPCFNNIEIKGTWVVPVIRSEMFLSYNKNGLANLFRLQNASVKNSIYVSPGDYHVDANGQSAALPLTSNTTLQLDGDVVLDKQTNNKFYNGYYVLSVNRANNVRICGKGSISGDYKQSGIVSEYGHGICVFKSSNVSIEGLTIKNVQGDGIAISIGCSNITVNGVKIEQYYRNGISVVDGSKIVIDNVTVRNGGDTSPYAAIDIEPNEGYTIDNVLVRKMTIENCGVGLSGYVPNNAKVTNVCYKGVRMKGVIRCCMTSSLFSDLELNDVYIEDVGENAEIMRFLENRSLIMSNVLVKAANSKAKYPFYLKNENLRVENCQFDCPQLFSWHLSNAQFKNSSFVFDSFIWTAADLANSNISFDGCTFDGPLFMRPDRVSFKNCVFRNGRSNQKYLVRFEDSRKLKEDYSGVEMDNNTFETGGNVTESSAIQCLTKKNVIAKSRYRSR